MDKKQNKNILEKTENSTTEFRLVAAAALSYLNRYAAFYPRVPLPHPPPLPQTLSHTPKQLLATAELIRSHWCAEMKISTGTAGVRCSTTSCVTRRFSSHTFRHFSKYFFNFVYFPLLTLPRELLRNKSRVFSARLPPLPGSVLVYLSISLSSFFFPLYYLNNQILLFSVLNQFHLFLSPCADTPLRSISVDSWKRSRGS